jgi:hypothetical protein
VSLLTQGILFQGFDEDIMASKIQGGEIFDTDEDED